MRVNIAVDFDLLLQTNPYGKLPPPARDLLSHVWAAETQQQVIKILAGARDMLRALPRDQRKYVLSCIERDAEEKPTRRRA